MLSKRLVPAEAEERLAEVGGACSVNLAGAEPVVNARLEFGDTRFRLGVVHGSTSYRQSQVCITAAMSRGKRLMIWRALLNLFTHQAASDAPPSWSPYKPVTVLPDEEVRAALMQTGLCHGRDEDVAFVKAAIGDAAFAEVIDLRRHGSQLDKPTLKAMKVRPTAKLTAEYLAILTPAGLADPIEAAQFLTSAYLSQIAGTNALGRAEHAGVEFVEVIPNKMAVGPCAACLKMAETPVPVAEAPSGPLPECPHPTQCKLWTRAVLAFD
jgi:hypothetical protein